MQPMHLSVLRIGFTATRGVKPIILIDEYDTPLQWAHEYGYYEQVLPIVRSMLGATLKTNGSFHKAETERIGRRHIEGRDVS